MTRIVRLPLRRSVRERDEGGTTSRPQPLPPGSAARQGCGAHVAMHVLRRPLRRARRNCRVHMPAAPSRPAHEAREKCHGEHDRQGPEENAADDAHASEHIGLQGSSLSC